MWRPDACKSFQHPVAPNPRGRRCGLLQPYELAIIAPDERDTPGQRALNRHTAFDVQGIDHVRDPVLAAGGTAERRRALPIRIKNIARRPKACINRVNVSDRFGQHTPNDQ
jgi:hypothetical protein